jgi:GTP diphosphokinase / guanosine-3',5'-bis(diphosphate) 3'-diphosphatase
MASPVLFDQGISEKSPETVDELIEKIKLYNPNADTELVRRAYEFSEKAHSGQMRRSGEPYITHPLGVAGVLADLRLDSASIIAALLHDTVEDTGVTLEEIEKQFGPVIRELVDGVTKLSQMKFRHTHEKQGENIRKMIIAMGKDVRVILVKLADRLHNMRTLTSMPPEKQKRIAEETLDIYTPLAGRLGINGLKIELEDLSFRYSQPDQYYDLVQKLNKKKKEREKYIEDVKELLNRELRTRLNDNVKFEVSGRPKHLYSIYKKITYRNVEYDQIYDLLAFRVVVNTIPECYEALGVVHSIWKPIPGRFKDFIAMPKTNDYQSLHTTVIGPGGERIEVQIRTEQMHLIADWGIAAHWKYKEDSRLDGKSSVDKLAYEKFNWLRDLVTLHQQTNNSDEFLENIKTDLTESEIYVFTPKGDVKELPEGSTPIDFAFSVHTDVGNRVVAARVNGRIVTLKHKLRNGDIVEVITSKTQQPSKDWLKMCVTSRAKQRIRVFVKTEQRKRSQELGKEIVERSFRKAGLPLQKSLEGPKYEKLLKDEGCQGIDDLYIRVGYGKITPQLIIEALGEKPKAEESIEKESFISKAIKSAVGRTKKTGSIISVDGMNDVLVRYAKCCLPIHGDPIVGFISRGRGISIHRADCEKAYEIDQARAVEVEWSGDPKTALAEHIVRVKVTSEDKSGLLKGMSEVFSSLGCNIMNVQARATRDRRAISMFDISVRDTSQLSQVIMALEKLPGVLTVERSSLAQD